MLRSVIEASVRRTSVWSSRLKSPLLAGKPPACRHLPAVAELQRHTLPANSPRAIRTQNETSVPLISLQLGRYVHLGGAFMGAGPLHQLHHSQIMGQLVRTAAAYAVESDHRCAPEEGRKHHGFTGKGWYWIERGPTEKDGPGYVYVMSEVDAKCFHCYKIGFTKLDPEVRVAQLAKKNGTKYKIEYHVYVRYHKNMEKALLEDLRARGMGLPKRLLACGKTESGGTEWVRGEDVVEICKRLVEYVQRLDKEGPRFRK